jgi:hypothetical protein
MAHAKTRPSLWLEGFPILSVVHPHNRTLAGLLPPAAENYIVYYRGRNQTSHSILASITPRRRNRQCNRIQGGQSNAPDPFLCVRSSPYKICQK